MLLSKYIFLSKRKNIKQYKFLLRMQKKRAFRKLKAENNDYKLKKTAFSAFKVNKRIEKNIRRNKLHILLYRRFEKYGLELPIALERWIYDE